jgi:hypothetical protein
MHNLPWAPIALTAVRELATSGLPDAPVVADTPRDASRPVRHRSGRRPRYATRRLRPLAKQPQALASLNAITRGEPYPNTSHA